MENEVKENKMMLANTTNVSLNLFGESRSKKITSLDLTDEEQSNMYLNSMNEADFKLNDCVGKTIEVIGVNITESEVDNTNDETGEVVTRKKHGLCLFDKDGKTYVTGSNACYYSFVTIVAIKGMPTMENPLKLTPVKVEAKEKGHSYLKLTISK